MLDHRRTWHFDVAAAPSECIDAFVRAFAGRGGLIAKANWRVDRRANGAAAVYEGRKGIGALGGMMSKTAGPRGRHGARLRGEVPDRQERTGTDRVLDVAQPLGRAGIGGLVGVTSDARFIRPYMQSVQREILAVDKAARIATG